MTCSFISKLHKKGKWKSTAGSCVIITITKPKCRFAVFFAVCRRLLPLYLIAWTSLQAPPWGSLTDGLNSLWGPTCNLSYGLEALVGITYGGPWRQLIRSGIPSYILVWLFEFLNLMLFLVFHFCTWNLFSFWSSLSTPTTLLSSILPSLNLSVDR